MSIQQGTVQAEDLEVRCKAKRRKTHRPFELWAFVAYGAELRRLMKPCWRRIGRYQTERQRQQAKTQLQNQYRSKRMIVKVAYERPASSALAPNAAISRPHASENPQTGTPPEACGSAGLAS